MVHPRWWSGRKMAIWGMDDKRESWDCRQQGELEGGRLYQSSPCFQANMQSKDSSEVLIHHFLWLMLIIELLVLQHLALLSLNLIPQFCLNASFSLLLILLEIAGRAGDERGNKYNLIQIWLWWSKLGCGPLAKYSFPETNGRCILWRPSLQFPRIKFCSLFSFLPVCKISISSILVL